MNQYRKKLLNAILYFARNTLYPYKTKIGKLLYYLDFTHFKQVGYPSIGLKYQAFKNGPLPRSFWEEVTDGIVPNDFKDHLQLVKARFNPKAVEFIAKKNPDLSIFSPREKKILVEIASKYYALTGNQMIEISHQERPWNKTYYSDGENAQIDYLLAIDDKSPLTEEEAAELLESFFEVFRNLRMSPELQ